MDAICDELPDCPGEGTIKTDFAEHIGERPRYQIAPVRARSKHEVIAGARGLAVTRLPR